MFENPSRKIGATVPPMLQKIGRSHFCKKSDLSEVERAKISGNVDFVTGFLSLFWLFLRGIYRGNEQ